MFVGHLGFFGLSHGLFKSSICNSRLPGRSSGIGYGYMSSPITYATKVSNEMT